MGSVFYIKKILPFSFYYTIFYLFCQSNKCLLARSIILGSYRVGSRSLEVGKNLHIGVLGRDSEPLRASAVRSIMGIEKNRKKSRFSLKKL